MQDTPKKRSSSRKLTTMGTVKFEKTVNQILAGVIRYKALDGRIVDFQEGTEMIEKKQRV